MLFIRHGFATNSSSSHSLVYLKGPAKDAYKPGFTAPYYERNSFILDRITEKVLYALLSRMGGYWDSSKYRSGMAPEIEPYMGKPKFKKLLQDTMVDHDSIGVLTDLDVARDPNVVVMCGDSEYGPAQKEVIKARRLMIEHRIIDWDRTVPIYEDLVHLIKIGYKEDFYKARESYLSRMSATNLAGYPSGFEKPWEDLIHEFDDPDSAFSLCYVD